MTTCTVVSLGYYLNSGLIHLSMERHGTLAQLLKRLTDDFAVFAIQMKHAGMNCCTVALAH